MKIIPHFNFASNHWLRSFIAMNILLLITACGGSPGERETLLTDSENKMPEVNAGSDQSVSANDNVLMVASANDSDGSIESYSWSQVSGIDVNLTGANTTNASFIAPLDTTTQTNTVLVFRLTAIDNDGASASDTVTITINQSSENTAPTVNAGNDVTVFEQNVVLLNATATDNGNITSYLWSQTNGRSVTINNSTSALANFTAPTLQSADTPETYVFEIIVTDDSGLTAIDNITITVQSSTSIGECNLTISPGTSFSSSFSLLSAGDTLCLNDGIYTQAMDIPSNINVKAVHDGMAELDGGNVLGIEWQGGILTMSGNNSSVRGLKVYHSGINSDACTILGSNNVMRLTSCSHGGRHKHKIPLKLGGSGHLVEDSWFYGEGRYVVQCFGGNNMTIRRNVIRWDETIAGEPDEPNASMSNYSCNDMIWENNISLDYGIPVTAMRHCGDICMSTNSDEPNLRVRYLGNIVVNHAQETENNVAFRADQKGSSPSSDISIIDFYVRNVRTGIVFNPLYQNITLGSCTMIDVNNQGGANGNPANCNNNADISVRYVNGIKTSEALFPFAHQALIKRDMCASDERQSEWCNSNKTLGDYVLDQ